MLLPIAAAAQTQIFNANLSGAYDTGGGDTDGAGFAALTFDVGAGMLDYSILVSGVPDATVAHVHMGAAGTDGSVVIDLGASFTNGAASGSVSGIAQSTIGAIIANPAGYYVNVHSTTFTDGAVRGQLMAGAESDDTLYFPVAAAVPGLGGTNFKTDLTVVNRSGGQLGLTIEYYPEGTDGNSAPSDTETYDIDANAALVVEDYINQLFGEGKGAIRLVGDRMFTATQRIYNDQTATDEGTFGQFVEAQPMSAAYPMGLLPGLSNMPQASAEGVRTNVGWFNPNDMALTVTFYAWDAETGAFIASKAREVAAGAQQQYAVTSTALFGSAFNEMGPFYLTYSVEGGYSVFVYASPVDNVSGDGSHIPALP